MSVDVWHFGGNGHTESRLTRARSALDRRRGGPALVDVPYPGFEGRPPSGSLDSFLDSLQGFCGGREPPAAAYASGIGALITLGLRARGELEGVPLIFQGPVLWGLADRAFPRVMRHVPLARWLLRRAFSRSWFQNHFVGKHFRRPLTGPTRASFFEGYARCAAFGAFFDWFTPDWLDVLEAQLAPRPLSVQGVTVWLGGADGVVGRRDVDLTCEALGVNWPVLIFPDWGHYPMIDEPEEWADALCDALATAGTLPRPDRPEAP